MARHAAPRRLATHPVPAKAVVAAAALALVGAGTFAAWTSTTGGTTATYSAATVTASDADANGTLFSTAVSNLLPGDYLYRYRDLTNSGSVSQTFTGAVTGAGTITAANGLTIAVDSCSVAWTTVGGVSTCASPTSVLATTGVSTAPSISYGSLAASGVLHLRYTFGLPSGASQVTFSGTSGTVQVAITGAAGSGGDRTAG